MSDTDKLVSGCNISGNPPSLATLGSHRDTSLIAELLSNSTFITSLSKAVAKQIPVHWTLQVHPPVPSLVQQTRRTPVNNLGHQLQWSLHINKRLSYERQTCSWRRWAKRKQQQEALCSKTFTRYNRWAGFKWFACLYRTRGWNYILWPLGSIRWVVCSASLVIYEGTFCIWTAGDRERFPAPEHGMRSYSWPGFVLGWLGPTS